MPMYDYVCDGCGNRFEEFRHLDDKTAVVCPACGVEARKVISAVGFAIHNTASEQRRNYRREEDDYYREKIISRFKLGGISKLNKRTTMKELYNDSIRQEGLINEQMAHQTEERARKTEKKQREWKKEALKRTPERAKVIKEYRAKEAYDKRKIKL